MSQQQCVYEFGSFRIDALKRVLLREGELVPLTSKSLDTLLVLVEHRGQVVTKDDLMKTLWPDTIVEENNLTQQISMLRKALGEGAREHRYVVTVPGRGYSFVAEVTEPGNGESDLIVSQHIRSRITVDVEDTNDKELPSTPRTDIGYQTHTLVTSGRRLRSGRGFAALAVSLVAIASLVVWISTRRTQLPENAGRNRSIAVLPFKLLNNDPANDYLGTGMADALIAKLSNIRQISVRPTSAIIKYAKETQNASVIGQDLGVDSVLEGTVQTVGDKVRVTVQLVNVRDRNPLWAQSFDENMTDIFALQDAISEHVAQAMLIRLNTDEQKQIRKRDTESVQAYQEYLRGRYFWNRRDEESLKKSLDHFQRAIYLDPNYAQAYAGLADTYALIVSYKVDSFSPADAVQKAKAAAVKALAIDESLPEAHASLGLIQSRYEHDDSSAEKEFRRAIDLNPNYATAHHWYSEFLVMTGRETEAMVEIKKAQELDPLSPVINTTLGERLFYLRHYDEAIEQLRRTLEIAPDFGAAHFALGLSLEQKGLMEEAISELHDAKGSKAISLSAAASLGHAYALAGQKAKALNVLNGLLNESSTEPYHIAIVYQGLGEKQKSIEWLTKIKDKTSELRLLLKFDPRLDGLRSETGFRQLL